MNQEKKQQRQQRRRERRNENKEIFKKFKSDFCKKTISSTSELICSLSANNQGAMTIVVAVFFILFTVGVVFKNFHNYSEEDSKVIKNFYHFAGFSVDFITLPFLIITVTFSALSSHYTSNFQLNVETRQKETKDILNKLYDELIRQAVENDVEETSSIDEVKKTVSHIVTGSEHIIPDKVPQSEMILPNKPSQEESIPPDKPIT